MRNKTVFSTDPTFDLTENQTEDQEKVAPNQQNLRIWLEKRPGNKIVSIIRDFKGTTEELKLLEKKLKKRCSVGGSTKGKDILIQTKDRQKLLRILKEMGYFAKLSGG